MRFHPAFRRDLDNSSVSDRLSETFSFEQLLIDSHVHALSVMIISEYDSGSMVSNWKLYCSWRKVNCVRKHPMKVSWQDYDGKIYSKLVCTRIRLLGSTSQPWTNDQFSVLRPTKRTLPDDLRFHDQLRIQQRSWLIDWTRCPHISREYTLQE
jgi:hypothetical protein